MHVRKGNLKEPLRGRRAKVRRVWLVMLSLALIGRGGCDASTRMTSSPSQKVLLTPETTTSPAPSQSKVTIPSLVPTTPAALTETATSQVERLTIRSLMPEEIGVYGLIELEVKSDITPTNPFDPEEIDIRVEFTSPDGKKVNVGAFWYQEYDATGKRSVGEPGWRARFTPTASGEWSAVAKIPTQGLESAALIFKVVPSDNPGFVRVNPTNPRYFALDDGSFFFPIGLNMAWWSGAGDALMDYKKWMNPFYLNGGNAIRVWMADWSFAIEWSNTPLGDYSKRLKQAWLLDQIFKLADERDIYIMLVLFNCGDFNNWQTNGWNRNPYNAALGGPLDFANQFVSDPTARALVQRRLNYITNRWGYSPNLLAWEWWNEVNLAPFSDQELFPWFTEMTAYLKARDVNQHLVTNSYAISHTSPSWSLPEMEIIQKHEYALQENTMNKDLAERAAAGFNELALSAPPKPILLGEFGYGNEGYGGEVDRFGIHLHNGIWATTFVGYAGSGWYWWWDVYVEKYNLWYHFNGLSQFLEGINLSEYQPFSPLKITDSTGESGEAAGLGLRGEELLIWLRSDDYTVQAATTASEALGSATMFHYNPPMRTDTMLTLEDMEEGIYMVRWYEPQFSRWLEPIEVRAQNGQLTLHIPDFRYDMAARITPIR
jgi:hypothetical protein